MRLRALGMLKHTAFFSALTLFEDIYEITLGQIRYIIVNSFSDAGSDNYIDPTLAGQVEGKQGGECNQQLYT